MADHNELGREGEAFAADYLAAKGYTIVAQNWTYQKAEIDLIVRMDDILCFVEVKTRTNVDFGLPQDMVKSKKIKTMVRAMDAFMQQQPEDLQARLDIIALHKTPAGFDVTHLEDAYYYF